MTTTSAELAEATDAQIAAARTALVAYLQAAYPRLSVTAGPLADAVLGPAADALAAVEAVSERRIAALDPETALATGDYDEATLTAALTGRGVTRGVAAAASGTAVLVFSANSQVVVSSAYRLETADGTTYKPTNPVTVRPTTATAVLSTDVVLTALPEGGYAAAIEFTAVNTGIDGNCAAATVLTPVTALTNQTAAYAGTDFTGGADAETDAALLARLPAASAPRTAASVAGIEALIRDAVPEISAVAVQGYGHAGLHRARSPLGLQSPGKVDARVRVATSPGRLILRVTATYQGTSGPYTSWRFTAAAEDIPGFFKIDKIIPAGAAATSVGYLGFTAVRGFDTSGDDYPPDIRTTSDATFSAYTTVQVTFSDTNTPTTGLTVGVSTKTYDAVLRYIPGIAAAQAAVQAASALSAGGDCLVRAAIPVLTTVTAAAVRPSGSDLTAAEVKTAVARAINETGIDVDLNGAAVAAAAAAYLPVGTTLTLTDWTAQAYAESTYTDFGTISAVASASGLTLETNWSAGLGPDAVAYYADPTDVTATVT